MLRRLFLGLAASFLIAPLCAGAPRLPALPEDGLWDDAHLLGSFEAAHVTNVIAGLSDHGIGLCVAVIPTLAAQGAEGMAIQDYATLLLRRWAPKCPTVVFLVSAGDHAAAIVLDDRWDKTRQQRVLEVLDACVLPSLRTNPVRAVLDGVRNIDAAARGLPIRPAVNPRVKIFWFFVVVPFAVLFVLAVASTLAPWRRVRRTRRMPRMVIPAVAGKPKPCREGWRHAQSLGRYQSGVEMEKPRIRYGHWGGF